MNAIDDNAAIVTWQREGAHRSSVPTNASARAVSLKVTFEPGARTAWHSHPLGRSDPEREPGCGRVQRYGGPVEEIRQGEIIWLPAWLAPGEKNWHGAAPITALTHIGIKEELDGEWTD
jgi:quercetin dioxygenase-like cupin family protein